MLSLITIVILSYLVGSIPTGIIIGKLIKGIDLRQYGSGSMGGTNAFRVLGWKAGLFVAVFDVLKGTFATLIVSQIRLGESFTDKMISNVTGTLSLTDSFSLSIFIVQLIAGVSAILGHIWTVFAGFKGGKGVATAAGMVIGLAPFQMAICFPIWLILLVSTRYMSIASMITAVSFPVVIIIQKYFLEQKIQNELLYFGIAIAILIVFTHRSNIKRLLSGTENRLSFSKK
jgi:glycerol-3-phosphate acyltransferase PlsY